MKDFSDIELQQLRANVNVKHVSCKTLRFTEAFKALAVEQYKQKKRAADILRENGLDPIVLGAKRVYNFAQLLRTRMSGSVEAPIDAFESSDDGSFEAQLCNCRAELRECKAELREVKTQLAYNNRLLEFVKKIQMANTEAQRQWESRQKKR